MREGVFHPTGDTLAISPDPDEHKLTLAMSLPYAVIFSFPFFFDMLSSVHPKYLKMQVLFI